MIPDEEYAEARSEVRTLGQLIEAVHNILPRSSVQVIAKGSPMPLIFIESGVYLGEPVGDDALGDHWVHGRKPEQSLPLIKTVVIDGPVSDDGGPTEEDMNPLGFSLGEEYDPLDEWIAKVRAETGLHCDVDKPSVEARFQMAAKDLIEKAERYYSKGFISAEELKERREVLLKAKSLISRKVIDKKQFKYLTDNNSMILPMEPPDSKDHPSDPEAN